MSGPSHAVLSGSSRYSLGSNRKDSLVQSKVKRHQVVVACNACRKRKVKCDGAQPVCSRCSSRTVGCTWSADPDTTPMLAMKQKYEILESECRDLHGLMQSLIDCPRQQAFNILDNLRKTRNVSLTLSLVGDDDTLVDLTNTANLQSISSNLPTSAHEYLRHVQDAVVSRTQGHPSSSEDFRKPHSAESHFLMRRLAISDLIITGNT